MTGSAVGAVLFDLGGVIFDSPIDAFGTFERDHDLPAGLLTRINSMNPDGNAWARAERGELDPAGFVDAFAAEATAVGYDVDAAGVLALLVGAVRPEMVAALEVLRDAGVPIAAVTNNMAPMADTRPDLADVLALFDVVVESSVEGVRKPEPAFYELALARLGVPATACVYLDDLGMNLKPGRAMGMTTIKVVTAEQALAELADVTGLLSLRPSASP